MSNLDGSPANVENSGPNEIPGILTLLTGKEVKTEEDAQEGGRNEYATHVVPNVAVSTWAAHLIRKVPNNRCCDTVCNLTAKQAQA